MFFQTSCKKPAFNQWPFNPLYMSESMFAEILFLKKDEMRVIFKLCCFPFSLQCN